MREKRIAVWLLLGGFAASCALCVWAWLFAIYLLFFGITLLPALFLQMLIRWGGKEWTWLLAVHAIILLCVAGVGGLIILLTENVAQLYGLLLANMGAAALVGCLFEIVIHLFFGKDESNEARS